jgi:hypothetical protein
LQFLLISRTAVRNFKITFKCHLMHVMMHMVVEKHEEQVTSIFCLRSKTTGLSGSHVDAVSIHS